MIVIVYGSRGWRSKAIIDHRLSKLPSNARVRHGGARGADDLGGTLALARGIPVEVVKAEWGKFGNAAGPIRNVKMLEMFPRPKYTIGFWDGKSTGTAHMIKEIKKRGIDGEVINSKGVSYRIDEVEVTKSGKIILGG